MLDAGAPSLPPATPAPEWRWDKPGWEDSALLSPRGSLTAPSPWEQLAPVVSCLPGISGCLKPRASSAEPSLQLHKALPYKSDPGL